MRVLVTGGYGFLGTYIAKELEANNHEVLRFHKNEYDLTSMEDTNYLLYDFGPDCVIHLAARVGGIGANQANPATFCYENLTMGTNIVEACHKYSVKKLVIAGTICAYPKFTPVPFKEEDLWNGYPEETNAPYGLAKKMLLILAQSYRKQFNSNFIYLLPVNLYGPKDNFDLNSSHVIPAMIRKIHTAHASSQPTVTLWGDGSPTREFLFVEDCAKAFVQALEIYNGPEPINIGSGQEISMKDLASQIKDLVGYQGEIVWDSSKPNGQPRRCLDTSRAQKFLKWQAATPFSVGLEKTYKWYLDCFK